MGNSAIEYAKLLIVDDDESCIRLLTAVLQNAGYSRLNSLTDAREAARHYTEFEPDLILVDFLMPYLDGLQLIEALQSRIPRSSYVPILVLTAEVDPSIRQRALSMGANDFITKPFDHTELVLRIKNLLETRLLYVQIHGRNQLLEEQVRQGTSALDQAQIEVIDCLEKMAGYRDDETAQHAQRVGLLAASIGRAMGFSEERVQLIRAAATLHDIGKIAIPDRILLKPGKLTQEEFDRIRKHTAIGAEILTMSHFSILKLAQEIAFYHHERWDGCGYNSTKGEDIPVAARIVTLADTFDVLTHDRPYRRAWPANRAVAEIHRERGRQFDPRVVDAFLGEFFNSDLYALHTSVAGLDQTPAADVVETPAGFSLPARDGMAPRGAI
ncbi:MAG: HD domain-containing phosphohydrolase [Bryobacteraceae bacterium]|jgi:putative two-component system response regulator